MASSITSREDELVMKLLHYFITEKNYNPIILQGVDNEIWLENLSANYEIIRIVSNHIHNDEQYDFDVFKTKRIVKKIKNKTFSLNMNVFSFFLDMGDSVTVDLNQENVLNGIKITDEKDTSPTYGTPRATARCRHNSASYPQRGDTCRGSASAPERSRTRNRIV